MPVDLRAKLFETRFYEPGKGYDQADPYYASMNVIVDGKQAVCSMARANQLTRPDLREFMLKLHAHGVEKLRLTRAVGHGVPFGRVVATGEKTADWEVDLCNLPFIKAAY